MPFWCTSPTCVPALMGPSYTVRDIQQAGWKVDESTDTFDARCLAGVDEYFVCPP
jgi:hypothetical protein